MKKKVVKEIRNAIAVLPEGMTYKFNTWSTEFTKNKYEALINHKRRAKRAYKRGGMDAVRDYVRGVMLTTKREVL